MPYAPNDPTTHPASTVSSFERYAMLQCAKSLEILEKALGPNAPQVLLALEESAKVLYRMKRDDDARTMEARAKHIIAEWKYVVRSPKK
jgi:hypothetical protein